MLTCFTTFYYAICHNERHCDYRIKCKRFAESSQSQQYEHHIDAVTFPVKCGVQPLKLMTYFLIDGKKEQERNKKKKLKPVMCDFLHKHLSQ